MRSGRVRANPRPDRADWPELRKLTSTGVGANSDPGNAEAREPTGGEIIFIQADEAHRLWGDNVYRMRGMTWLWNDGNCGSPSAHR